MLRWKERKGSTIWIFSIYGFYSASAVSGDRVAVRARSKRHLTNLLTRFDLSSKIVRLRYRDYPYRVYLPKPVWMSIVAGIAEEQTWSNFKGEVKRRARSKVDRAYETALHRVWYEMLRFQEALEKTRWQRDKAGARESEHFIDWEKLWPTKN